MIYKWIVLFYLLLLSSCILSVAVDSDQSLETQSAENLKALFDQKYQAWVDYITQPEIFDSCRMKPFIDNEPFREIVALGVPALPLVMEKVNERGKSKNLFMARAAGKILKRTNWKEGDKTWDWWETAPEQVPVEFATHFAAWQEAKAQGDTEKAAASFKSIEGIGVLALPLIIEQIEASHTDLTPIASRLTNEAIPTTATTQDITTWWTKDKAKWTLPEEKKTAEAEGEPASEPDADPNAGTEPAPDSSNK